MSYTTRIRIEFIMIQHYYQPNTQIFQLCRFRSVFGHVWCFSIHRHHVCTCCNLISLFYFVFNVFVSMFACRLVQRWYYASLLQRSCQRHLHNTENTLDSHQYRLHSVSAALRQASCPKLRKIIRSIIVIHRFLYLLVYLLRRLHLDLQTCSNFSNMGRDCTSQPSHTDAEQKLWSYDVSTGGNCFSLICRKLAHSCAMQKLRAITIRLLCCYYRPWQSTTHQFDYHFRYVRFVSTNR